MSLLHQSLNQSQVSGHSAGYHSSLRRPNCKKFPPSEKSLSLSLNLGCTVLQPPCCVTSIQLSSQPGQSDWKTTKEAYIFLLHEWDCLREQAEGKPGNVHLQRREGDTTASFCSGLRLHQIRLTLKSHLRTCIIQCFGYSCFCVTHMGL